MGKHYEKKFLRIGEVAAILGVSASGVRKWTNEGKLTAHRLPTSNQRVYSTEEVKRYQREMHPMSDLQERIVFYTRSSNGNDVLLATQTELLTQAHGEPTVTYQDKCSGLRDTRPGLTKMIQGAKNQEFNTIAITHPDRLTRFGYAYLETLFDNLGVKIVTLNDKEDQSLQEELMNDFMALITSFSGRFYRLRGIEQRKKLLAEAAMRLNEKTDGG